MTTTLYDPLQTVWDALDAHDCQPQGCIWKATARCPAHDDRTPSLSISEGADGRAVFHCHAGCRPETVVGALGLRWSDLFPLGHRNAIPHRVLAKPKPLIQLVLDAVLDTGSVYKPTPAVRCGWSTSAPPVSKAACGSRPSVRRFGCRAWSAAVHRKPCSTGSLG